MAKPKLKSDGRTITVRVPISIRKRGGRKVVLAPDGAMRDPRKLFSQQVDNAMVKAIARAFRWREVLERAEYATIKELAEAEKINHSYVARVVRLTLLAPDIVETILSGKQPPSLTLPVLMECYTPIWAEQRQTFGKQ